MMMMIQMSIFTDVTDGLHHEFLYTGIYLGHAKAQQMKTPATRCDLR